MEAMNERTDDGHLLLEVTDFGPIISSKIDLRPLTVFVGPTNTGKSYLAILIYALHRVFGGVSTFALGRGFPGNFRPQLEHGDRRRYDAGVHDLIELASRIADRSDAPSEHSFALPNSTADALRLALDDMAVVLFYEIGRSFGIGEPRKLIRRTKKNASRTLRVVMRQRKPDGEDFTQQTLSLGQTGKFTTSVPKGIQIPADFSPGLRMARGSPNAMPCFRESNSDRRRRLIDEALLLAVRDKVLPSLVSPLHLPA